jgi:hypothetical protein
VNTISPRRVPFSLDVVLPARSDRLAWNLGLLETDLPLEEAQRAFRIDEVARAGGPPGGDFSKRIRSETLGPLASPRGVTTLVIVSRSET